MFKIALSVFGASLLALSFVPNSAQAQTRVFVAAQGSDANPCTFALPCRGFQQAHDTVAAGGEIDVLDPAGYGKLVITKDISIQGHGVAGISAGASSDAITINAGASDKVSLLGLIIEGAGNTGIRFNSGQSLTVQNCVIRSLAFWGILFFPSASASLAVSDSSVVGTGSGGIRVEPSAAGVTLYVLINRVEVHDTPPSTTGFAFSMFNASQTKAAVVDSAAFRTGDGFLASAVAGTVELTLTRSISAGNYADGVHANGAGARIRLAQSNSINNGAYGWEIENSATIETFGDNYIAGNTFGNVGTLTTMLKQ